MIRALARIASVAVMLALSIGRADGLLVGYFTDFNPGATGLATPITTAGHTPQQVTNISTFNFSTVNMLMINESQNGAPSAAMQGRVGDLTNWVTGGGCLIVHDRNVAQGGLPNPLLVGLPIPLTTSFGTNLDPFGPNPVVNGPFGTITNTTLDGGNFSSHGFALATNLPVGATKILQIGTNANQIAAFSYGLGAGHVYYSTIPLDFYLVGGNNPPRTAIRTIYTPNVIAYMADVCATGDPVVPEPSSIAMLAGAGLALLRRRRRRA